MSAATFSCEFPFTSNAVVLRDGHTTDNCCYIDFGDHSILVKVVHVEHEFEFLVETGTVEIEHSIEKFLLVQVLILVHIYSIKESLGEQSRQLAVVKHGELVHSLRLVVTALLQILEDVFEVGNTNFLLEVLGLKRLRELQYDVAELKTLLNTI